MKMLLVPLLAASVLAAALVSLGLPLRQETSQPLPPGGELPATYVIDFGTAVALPDGRMLGFVEVVEDSRCPADAMCIWQGRAVVAFTLGDEYFQVDYRGPGEGSAMVDGLVVDVRDVQPYPLASQPADKADYQVTVTVSEVP